MTNFSDKTDGTLVELTLLGNDQAYGELVTRHEKAVKGTAYKITGNTYSAEDASQDAFVAAWMKLDSLSDYDKFRAWVCSIARNTAVDLVRRYNATENISLDTGLLSSDIPDCAWEDIERAGDLRDAVARLSEKIREVVELHYFEGYSTKEIAHRLSLPEGTVTWRLSEGRRQLRKGYGIMDKTEYNDKETLVTRVLREVEQLKLWRLKYDKTGFKAEYEAVLKSVENLDDSKEKSHALADVMMMGYWWLPGEKSDEVLAKIKALAEENHNEEVMREVITAEISNNDIKCHFDHSKSVDFIQNNIIPYLKKHSFNKALYSALLTLGIDYHYLGKRKEAKEAYSEIIHNAAKSELCYSSAQARLDYLEKSEGSDPDEYAYFCGANELKRIYNKWFVWNHPGSGNHRLTDCSVLNNMVSADYMFLLDESMKPGDMVKIGNGSLSLLSDNEIITTEAGRFEHCSVFLLDNKWEYDPKTVKTYLCPGVGIVYQECKGENHIVFSLDEYDVTGDGLLPLEEKNKWIYDVRASVPLEAEGKETMEVTFSGKDTAIIKQFFFAKSVSYSDTWTGVLFEMSKSYYKKVNGVGIGELNDVTPLIDKLQTLAEDKSQKRKTAAAISVMRRILDTDPEFNPDFTEKGVWNFYHTYSAKAEKGVVYLGKDNDPFSFEWKDFLGGTNDNMIIQSQKVLYNFLYDILNDGTGCLWSEKWVPGYKEERVFLILYDYKVKLRFIVKEDENVTTQAGTFNNCRHIWFDLSGIPNGCGHDYRGGTMEYWFAPGVGIVQFFRLVRNKEIQDMYWQLTDYSGTGEGYFPLVDGAFRRYEPVDISCGYRAWVEYTFDETEKGFDIIRNACGTLDREGYEEIMRYREQKKAEKEIAEKEKAEQAEEQKAE